MSTKTFPTILISLMVASSLVCLYNKEYAKAAYWFSGAAINLSVLFM